MDATEKNLSEMTRFGIAEGISELILTTRNAPGSEKIPHAAPFGVIWKKNKLFLHLYKGSQTLENLMREDYFAAHSTDDAVLFAQSAFYELEEDAFEMRSFVEETASGFFSSTIPILKKANRAIVFKCTSRTVAPDAVFIDIKPVMFLIINEAKDGFVFNRGFHAVVEACIHLTRFALTKDPIYIDEIERHQRIIQKCGRKIDKDAFSIVQKKLEELK